MIKLTLQLKKTKNLSKINEANNLFKIYTYNFLLHIAVNEEDQIDNKIKENGFSTKHIWSNDKCSKLLYSLKRKCDSCGGVVDKYYQEVGSQTFYLSNVFNENKVGKNKVLENLPIIKMLEPIWLNPNSYKIMHHILKQLTIFAKVGMDREWVFIGCDVLPYCLPSKIVKSSPDEFDFTALVPR